MYKCQYCCAVGGKVESEICDEVQKLNASVQHIKNDIHEVLCFNTG